ncbi:MAG: AhpC/TSA family protein [Kofleriaceae bacterium]|nr:AhpC/TSA family protein [Kofleriaceae bacterium]MBP9170671.1 AhpC/TSA family protein [Kofleriaceae bacterium]MBP9860909.1 AhpC/TSA family protein [Kofleriaceae bacterium]
MSLPIGQPAPAALAAAVVTRADGTPLTLGAAWAERDLVLVFVRHFACAGCSQHVAALRPRLDEVAALGAAVVIVGSGNPTQLAAFTTRERLAHPAVTCATDPTLAAYRAAGLSRSAWGTLGPIALGQLVAALARGHVNGRPQGDLYQQGGTLVLARGGVVLAYHRAAHLGEHLPVVDVVDVLLAARAAEVGR